MRHTATSCYNAITSYSYHGSTTGSVTVLHEDSLYTIECVLIDSALGYDRTVYDWKDTRVNGEEQPSYKWPWQVVENLHAACRRIADMYDARYDS